MSDNPQTGPDIIVRVAPGYAVFLVRFYALPTNHIGLYWLDFSAWEVTGELEDGTLSFGIDPDPIGPPTEKNRLLEGYIKWDGCMQGTWLDGFHFDAQRDVDQLHLLLTTIRREANNIMPIDEFDKTG